MSIGTIILIILVIALLGGFSGVGGGPFLRHWLLWWWRAWPRNCHSDHTVADGAHLSHRP